MKGSIIIFDEATHSGKISGHDGQRYSFTRQSWSDAKPPKQGMEVDFDIAGNEAKDIILLGQKSGQIDQSLSYLSPYWQMEFTQIKESNETYKGHWNWAAFFFGIFWAMSKGLWLNVLVAIITIIITLGFGGWFWIFYYPIRGNYMNYKKIVKRETPVV